jgi:hypothetical protein
MSPVEKEPVRTFRVQLRAVDGGPWPSVLEIEAHTVCEKDGKLVFKTNGEISGRITGDVAGWWSEE